MRQDAQTAQRAADLFGFASNKYLLPLLRDGLRSLREPQVSREAAAHLQTRAGVKRRAFHLVSSERAKPRFQLNSRAGNQSVKQTVIRLSANNAGIKIWDLRLNYSRKCNLILRSVREQ